MKTRYIAFLRGINVGGRTVKMERIRELFAGIECMNVRTYIQSGNVFFDTTARSRAALAAKIEKTLEAELGYEVPVFLRTIPEVERILEDAPFKGVEPAADERHFVIFHSGPLPADLAFPFRSPKGDMEILQATKGETYMRMRLTDGRPGNTGAFMERDFKVKTTSRFYHTMEKILAAAKAGES